MSTLRLQGHYLVSVGLRERVCTWDEALTGSWSLFVDRLWLPRIWVGTDWDILFLMPVSSLQDTYMLTFWTPTGNLR